MRWTKRKYKLKSRNGETRIVRMFLFLPITFGTDTRWMEVCLIEQKVTRTKKGHYKWVSIGFKK